VEGNYWVPICPLDCHLHTVANSLGFTLHIIHFLEIESCAWKWWSYESTTLSSARDRELWILCLGSMKKCNQSFYYCYIEKYWSTGSSLQACQVSSNNI
jgi:hypothetical protein